MALEGDWFAGFLGEAKFSPTSDLGVFAFPTGTGRIYGLQQANYVSKTSKHPDAAAKFLDFWMCKDTQTKYAGSWSQIPVVDGVPVKDNGVGLSEPFNQLANAAKGQFQNNDQTLPLDVTTEYWRIMNGVATDPSHRRTPGSRCRRSSTTVRATDDLRPPRHPAPTAVPSARGERVRLGRRPALPAPRPWSCSSCSSSTDGVDRGDELLRLGRLRHLAEDVRWLRQLRAHLHAGPGVLARVRNTVIWVVLSLVVPTALGLFIALGLNRKLFGRNLLRSAFYIPAVWPRSPSRPCGSGSTTRSPAW